MASFPPCHTHIDIVHCTLCLIGPQASAGNLDEAAGLMAQLIAQMDDGSRPQEQQQFQSEQLRTRLRSGAAIARACAILQLSRLRTRMLTRSLSALRALKALSALRLSYIRSHLQIQSHLLCRFQDAGALSSLSPAPQLCCCCATGLLAADWLVPLHACTHASHGISHNSSSSLATTARRPAGRSRRRGGGHASRGAAAPR